MFYCLIELLIGAFGLCSVPLMNYICAQSAGNAHWITFLGLFLFLMFPTSLMGMILPVLTKLYNDCSRQFLKTVSYLYSINTFGAATGTLVASYGIISFWGLNAAIITAATINIALALILAVHGNRSPVSSPIRSSPIIQEPSGWDLGQMVYVISMVQGFLAIGFEIIWFRIISILVKSSPYAFSSILFVYLIGISTGSFFAGRFTDKKPLIRRNLFFTLQFFIGFFIMVQVSVFHFLTHQTIVKRLIETSFLENLHPRLDSIMNTHMTLHSVFCSLDIFFWPVFFILVPTILMGASFPLISAIANRNTNKPGLTIGKVYGCNILGNVLGGLMTGLIVMPVFSSERTLYLYAAIAMMFGIFISSGHRRFRTIIRNAGFVMFLVFTGYFTFPKPGDLFREIHPDMGSEFVTYLEEGIDGVSITYTNDDRMFHYINGVHHGGRIFYIYHFMASEAVCYADQVENVLVIGYGNGTISEVIQKLDGLKRITIVELSKCSINNLLKIPLFVSLLSDPKVELIQDDGRRFLIRSTRKFDLILIDAMWSTEAYSNNIYSREFYQLIRQHLNPGGIFMTWIDEHRVIPLTISTEFPYVRQYQSICLASQQAFRSNSKPYQNLLSRLTPSEISGKDHFKDSYSGDENYIREQSAGYPVNTDLNPFCEYYLGLMLRNMHHNSPAAAVHPRYWTMY